MLVENVDEMPKGFDNMMTSNSTCVFLRKRDVGVRLEECLRVLVFEEMWIIVNQPAARKCFFERPPVHVGY